jgi:potassium-transporting ATPase KdpC subunit
MRLPSWIAQHLAALRALLVFTVVLGLAYRSLWSPWLKFPGSPTRLKDHS